MKVTRLGYVLFSNGSFGSSRQWKPVLRWLNLMLLLLGVLPAAAQINQTPGRVGLPEDWSHHHVVFSNGPSIAPDVAQAVASDTRFWQQQYRRMLQPVVPPGLAKAKKRRVDWSVSLGTARSRLAAGMFPAKYTFDINASPSCSNDFAVFALNIVGSAGQATIVAYNNLYSGTTPATGICGSGLPTVKWAYNTSGAINTSPVLSLDGKKVAWVASANPPVLHVLTIGTTGNNGTAATSPAPGIGGLNNNAVDTTLTFGSVGDTRSSLFVDYSNDVAYVASDDGTIHKFTGLFYGTPAEVLTGGWPIHGQDVGNHVLTSVVYDSVSKNLFYGSDAGTLGYVRETGSTRGVCASGSPPCLGLNSYSLTGALIDGPLVDPVAQNVFAFVGNNGSAHAAVQQADTQLSTHGAQVNVGQNGPAMFDGAFDNNYYTNPSTGFLYVCGYTGSGTVNPTLYRIGFKTNNNLNGAADATTFALSNSATGTTCSPMTEIFNAPTLTDWLFVGVGDGCTGTGGGSAGCAMSLNITSAFPASAVGRAEAKGTSGIVVDNVSTSGQASSIYFSTQDNQLCGDGTGTGGCAVKLTQSALQ